MSTPPRSHKTGIALLAKEPVAGMVKTRFCPPCTPEEAADFARAFLSDTAEVLAVQSIADQADGWCSFLGDHKKLSEIFGNNLLLQRGCTFGERIANATEDLFDMGYLNTIALCADCPTVDAAYLASTLDLLTEHDVVFGPALDGGCVLVGLSTHFPNVFADVEMGTDHVLDDMKAVARKHMLKIATLPARYDLDRITDLTSAVEAGELKHAHHTLDMLNRSRFTTV